VGVPLPAHPALTNLFLFEKERRQKLLNVNLNVKINSASYKSRD